MAQRVVRSARVGQREAGPRPEGRGAAERAAAGGPRRAPEEASAGGAREGRGMHPAPAGVRARAGGLRLVAVVRRDPAAGRPAVQSGEARVPTASCRDGRTCAHPMDTSELKSDASAALAAGDFARAGTLYASYCAATPADTQSLLRMGDAWARAVDRPRAISAYLAAAQGFAADGFLARAIAASKLVLELEPGHQRMQRILADLYTQRGVGPGVRPRAVPPPPARAPPPEAAPLPASRTAEDDAPELVVTEFVLDTPSP